MDPQQQFQSPPPQQQPMSQQPVQPRNKVPLIIGGVIAVIILFTPLVLIFSKGSSPSSSSSSSPSSSSSSTTDGKTSPFARTSDKNKAAPVPTPYFSWDTYTDEKFSMAYPQTWLIKQTRETEGKTVVFKPPTIGQNEYLPSIMVTVRENKAHPWLVETEEYYRTNLGYVESSVMVDGLKAAKLFGTFPSKKNPSQSIHIFLTKDNYSYLIKYQYAGTRSHAETERLFTAMIANFKFR